ncbi:GPR22 protein, partial [Amia calva]|nr:GPR22 protein [Amia calva]
MLELVLGFSSNLTVLVLYCAQSNLVDSVSNMVTVNLHVLDIIVCVLCVPLTIVIILLPLERDIALVCCFHEACVTFTSIATAVNVLVISMDRYDISVRPANRVLTPRRAGALLAAVWGVSLAVFFIPFLEVELVAWRNRTLLCVGGQGYHTGLGMYYHLLIQVPIFFLAVVVMLVTYSRILQALNIRIGVFKMSLVIISTFLGCWAPISVVNVLILCLGPSDQLVKLRICFLAMAYGTTIFHPLLYAFTRQKLRKVLKTKVKKRVVSLLQVDPAPSGTVIHNSWVEPRKGRKVRLECSDATDRCLTEAVRE